MAAVRGHFKLKFYGVLPSDDGEADDVFDQIENKIVELLNDEDFSELGVAPNSWSIVDGDTEADE